MHLRDRSLLAGLLLLVLTLAACGGVANPDGWAPILEDEGRLLVFPEKDRLEARSLDTGAVLWRFPDKNKPDQKKLKFEAVYDDPIRDGGALHFASLDGKLISLNAADGSLRWVRDDFKGGVIGGPVLVNGLLIFGTDASRIYARNATDGSPAASWPQDGINPGEQVWAPPVVSGEVVIVATMGGSVQAYRLADGSPAWAEPFQAEGAVGDLAVVGGKVFVPSLDKHVYLLDPATGREAIAAFTATDWVWTTPAVADGAAYFGDFGGQIVALDLATGRNRWAAPYDAASKSKAAPVLIGGVLILATRDAVVHFLNAADGTRLNAVPLPDSGTVRAPITVIGGKGYIVTTDGHVYIADPANRSVNLAPGGRN